MLSTRRAGRLRPPSVSGPFRPHPRRGRAGPGAGRGQAPPGVRRRGAGHRRDRTLAPQAGPRQDRHPPPGRAGPPTACQRRARVAPPRHFFRTPPKGGCGDMATAAWLGCRMAPACRWPASFGESLMTPIRRLLRNPGRLLVLVFVLFSPQAHADCLGIARGITSTCLADTGDGKVAALYLQNQKCIRRRVVDISKAWRSFNAAVDSLDPAKIQQAAAEVWHQTNTRSSMFTSCWKTMRNSCNFVGGTVDQSIRGVSLGTCK